MTPQRALEAIGQLPDEEIDIAEAALQFARIEEPDAAALAAARAHLSEIARAAAGLVCSPGSPLRQADALSDLLALRFGYRGDSQTYDSLDNANLIRVTQRRRGLPVALGIVWIHAARTAGWQASGINFPGHFLIALGEGRARAFLDVFAGGGALTDGALRGLLRNFEGPEARLRPEVLAAVSDRAVLLRLQNNIKLRRLRDGDVAAARRCNTDMLRLAPRGGALWRDAALLAEKSDDPGEALAAWQRFLDLGPDPSQAEMARDAIRQLRSRLH